MDDIHGADFAELDGDPMDDHGHGSHCAGIVGAEGDNKFGGSGVMKDVKIIACKFLAANGSGSASDAIFCLNYFRDLKTRALLPANIFATSNSWGGAETSQSSLTQFKNTKMQAFSFSPLRQTKGKTTIK